MSEGTRTAVDRTGEEQSGALARYAAHLWQQEDLVLDQGRSGHGSGLDAYQRTRTWKHARGGRLSAPALHEQKRWTFEQLAPEPIPPDTGLPEPVDPGALNFVTRRARSGRGRTAPMMWTMGEAGFDEALLGQEVNQLYQWMAAQRATVDPIAALAPLMHRLQRNGVLDDDFRVAGEAHLDALLHDVARTGRADVYRSDGPAIAAGVLDASRQVAESEADAQSHGAQVQELKTQVHGLQSSLRAARLETKAFYERRAQHAAEREAASLLREKTRVLAWIDGLAGVIGGWTTAFKAATGPSTLNGKLDTGSGAFGALTASGKLVVNLIYESRIDEVFTRVAELRTRAEGFEAARLMAKLDGVETTLRGLKSAAADLHLAMANYRTAHARTLGQFGATVADAVPRMEMNMRASRDGPFMDGSPQAGGRVQRLFANMPLYEEAASIVGRIAWPQLTGDIPMSGYLYWSDSASTLADIAEEAAKLRWWQLRTTAVVDLLGRLGAAVDATGNLAASR